jgi:hypothetical protein
VGAHDDPVRAIAGGDFSRSGRLADLQLMRYLRACVDAVGAQTLHDQPSLIETSITGEPIRIENRIGKSNLDTVSRAARETRNGAVLLFAPEKGRGTDVSMVEDWAQQAIGATGVPPGWNTYATGGGRPAYDFVVAEDDGRRALHLKSHDEHSTIAKKIRVDLRATPFLEWTWKIVTLPAGADIRQKGTSDLTGHILVAWPRFPALLRTRLIGYVWDTIAPAQTVEKSRKTGAVTFFVVRSGPRDLNRWLTERRNVYEDYKKLFGENPENPQAVVV